MKVRIPEERKYFSTEGMEKAEQAILHTWNELRDKLKNKDFLYNDVDSAKSTTFLSTFDDLFIGNKGYVYFEKQLGEVFKQAAIARGTIIKAGEPKPNYDRMMPVSDYITEDNRFSPKGVEWLYLAIGFPKADRGYHRAKLCTEKECRVVIGNEFAICKFEFNTTNDKKVVDLTVGDNWSYDIFDSEIKKVAKRIVRRKTVENIISTFNGNTADTIPFCQDNIVKIYAQLLSTQIFTPIETADKSLIYAPFHCIAQYFLSLGYSGIIYKSTVYDKGKNIVLFDKSLAQPTGDIITYTI